MYGVDQILKVWNECQVMNRLPEGSIDSFPKH